MFDAALECRELVRQHDRDTYLATLFAPEAAQPHIFALHAYAIELARIPALVSEPQIGEIRLQWWADTLESQQEAGEGGHPVAMALAEAVRVNKLPLQPLQQMIEARRFDLYADAMPDMTSLEGYFGETCSVLVQLSCLILDRAQAPAAASAAGVAGVAIGLAGRLVAQQHVTKLTPPGQDHASLVHIAEQRLAEARQAVAEIPKSLLPAFLPLALARLDLAAVQQGKSRAPQWRRQWCLWRAARSEKF
jgi:phytoene synthase